MFVHFYFIVGSLLVSVLVWPLPGMKYVRIELFVGLFSKLPIEVQTIYALYTNVFLFILFALFSNEISTHLHNITIESDWPFFFRHLSSLNIPVESYRLLLSIAPCKTLIYTLRYFNQYFNISDFRFVRKWDSMIRIAIGNGFCR